ncbi:hypothetical protein FKB34_11170 [Glycocaulis profundi]|nr:hypothetical protein FKB34_11170 [Glycocaulis profundi]
MLWLMWHMWVLLFLAFFGGIAVGWIMRGQPAKLEPAEAPAPKVAPAPPAPDLPSGEPDSDPSEQATRDA